MVQLPCTIPWPWPSRRLVDVLSNGRLLLGVGRGSAPDAFQAFGVPWAERDDRFREGLEIFEQTWAHERVTYRGRPSVRRSVLAAHLPFDVVAERMAVFGSVDDCIEKIARMAGGGVVDELVCWFAPGAMVPHEQVLEAMQMFRERVVPGVPGAPGAGDASGVNDASVATVPDAPGAAASA